jgi:hypothetical protein
MRRAARVIDRRRLLGTAAACALSTGVARAQPVPPAPLMIVAGPAGGWLDQWAGVLAGPIGRGLPGRAALAHQNVGGLDGVTGANQFEARGEPDGGTALLVPGSVALPWLVGETRVKFDPGRWIPLWGAPGPAVLVSRYALQEGRPLRIAASGPIGPELPALLALDMMGIEPTLSPMASADAMLLSGSALRAALASASVRGMQPALLFCGPGSQDETVRMLRMPGIPFAADVVAGRATTDMLAGLRAATLAITLEAGLVLPQLTPATAVAQWRSACAAASSDPDVVAEAARHGVWTVTTTAAASTTGVLAGNAPMLLALRQWLATRFDWRPG